MSKRKYVVFLTLFLLFGFFCEYRTKGFSVNKVLSAGQILEHDIEHSAEQINFAKGILNQKFFYLNKGRQCYVFESEDHKYVIKIINHSRFRLPFSFLSNFFDKFQKIHKKREKRKKPTFQSIQLAYKQLKKQAGLIYVQLSGINSLKKCITLIDAAHREHKVDTSRLHFLIQAKAEMIYPALKTVYKTKGEKGLKKALNSLIDILVKRIEKNIEDDDLDIEINFGFLHEKAIFIDVGRFSYNPQLASLEERKKEILKTTKFFRKWLEKKFPEQAIFFEKNLLERLF